MKNRMRKVQVIAFVLSVLILLNIPLPVLAQAAVENAIEEAQNQPVLMTDKLTETETYWQNADGSITYEQHLEPIRYQDEEGNWKDICNNIVEVDKSETSTDTFKEEMYDYRSEASKVWVLLDDDIRTNAPIKMQIGEYVIYSKPLWGEQMAQTPQLQKSDAPAPIPEAAVSPQQMQEETEIEPGESVQNQSVVESRISFIPKEEQPTKQKASSRMKEPQETPDAYTYYPEWEYEAVEYSNVFAQNTSLRLAPRSQGYKEDIILLQRPEQNSFSFALTVEGVVLELDANNVVWIKDEQTEEVIGYIPQPFMTDGSQREEADRLSFDIDVSLQENPSGQYVYTLTPSAAYLDDPQTVYPVNIDPSAVISGASNTSDTYVDSSNPTKYYTTNQYLRVGRDTEGAVFRSFVKFNLPSDLAGSYVTSATLHTYQTYTGTTNPVFGLYRVTQAWDSATLNWNNQPSVTDGYYIAKNIGAVGTYDWDMRLMAQEWANGTSNYGLALISHEEHIARYKRFASSDAGQQQISLTIQYAPVPDTCKAEPLQNKPDATTINTSKGRIKVSWDALPSGVDATVYIDGEAFTPSSNPYTSKELAAHVAHKVKVRFQGTYFDKFTDEVIVTLPDTVPPQFAGMVDGQVENGKLRVSFPSAVETQSTGAALFAVWTEQGGQDDIIWYSGTSSQNGDWTVQVSTSNHNNETGLYHIHCYAYNKAGSLVFQGRRTITLSPLQIGNEVLQIQNSGTDAPAISGLEVEPNATPATGFSVTAKGMTATDSIASYKIEWTELGNEERTLLEILENPGAGIIKREYSLLEKNLPGGATIQIYVTAYDASGNYTPIENPSGLIDVPAYIAPQAPSLLWVENDYGERYEHNRKPLFAEKESADIYWQIPQQTDDTYGIGQIQYRIVEAQSQEWYSILYGSQTAYVRRQDAELIREAPSYQAQIIKTDILNVRALPDATSAMVGYVTRNTKLDYIETDEQTGWHKIVFEGQQAYISGKYSVVIPKEPTQVVEVQPVDGALVYSDIPLEKEEPRYQVEIVNTEILNVRSGPNANSTMVGYVTLGTRLDYIETDAATGWHKVMYNDQPAYVSGKYTIKMLVGSQTVTGSLVQGVAASDTRMFLYEPIGDWYRIRYGEGIGYLHHDDVIVLGQPAALAEFVRITAAHDVSIYEKQGDQYVQKTTAIPGQTYPYQDIWITITGSELLDTSSQATLYNNGARIPLPLEGKNTVQIRALDANPLYCLAGPATEIVCIRDSIPPVITMQYPQPSDGQIPTLSPADVFYIQQVEDAQLSTIKAEIGIQPLAFPFMPVFDQMEWNWDAHTEFPLAISLSGLDVQAGVYTLRVTAIDSAGNQTVETYQFYLDSAYTHQNKKIKLYIPDDPDATTMVIRDRVQTFCYEAVEGFTMPTAHTVQMFVDGHPIEILQTDPIARTITVDTLSETNQNLFKENNVQNIYLVITDSATGETAYSATLLSNDKSMDLRTSAPESVVGWFAQENGYAYDAQATEHRLVLPAQTDGQTLISQLRIKEVEGQNPQAVEWFVQWWDGQSYGQQVAIQVGQVIQAPGGSYGYRFIAEGPESASEPIVLSRILAEQIYVGQSTSIRTVLVQAPSSLTASALSNYTVWLRWNPSQTQDVLYDVYRKSAEAGNSEAVCIAANLNAPYFYDYNLMYGEKFDYWVVAKKAFIRELDEKVRTSMPSNLASSTMVSEDEIKKQLGLQDYWTYAAANMGSGTGYINIANGNFVYQKTDFVLTAPVLASTMRRTYNSQSTAISALGKGWDFSFNTNLLIEYEKDETGQTVEKSVILKDGDGSLHRYEKLADGSYRSPSGVFLTLEKQNGRYKAIRSDDIVYTFGTNMMIESFAEPNGNQIRFTYDDRGRLKKVMHSLYEQEGMGEHQKQYIEFVYGNEISELLPEVMHDRILQVKVHYQGRNDVVPLVEQVYAYHYDEQGNLQGVTTKTERSKEVVVGQAQGNELLYPQKIGLEMTETYSFTVSDAAQMRTWQVQTPSNQIREGQPITTYRRDKIIIDAQGRVSEYENAEGDRNAFVYTTQANGKTHTAITSTVDGVQTGTMSYITNPNQGGVVEQTTTITGKRTCYTDYTEDTLKPQHIAVYDGDEQNPVSIYELSYDSRGNITHVVDPLGIETEYTYQTGTSWLTMEQIWQGDTLLNKAVYTYDEKGNRLTQTLAVSNPQVFEDVRTTAYEYDSAHPGLLKRTTAWNGQQISYAYDMFGRLSQQTVSGVGVEQKTLYTYDVYNNPATVSQVRSSGNITTRYTYDSLGYLNKTVSPTGSVHVYLYNLNGLQVEQADVDMRDGVLVEAQRTKVQYDELNRSVRVTLADGAVQTAAEQAQNGGLQTTTRLFADAGHLSQGEEERTTVTTEAYDGRTVTTMSGTLGTKTQYDVLGNAVRIAQLYTDQTGALTEGRSVRAEYDALCREVHSYEDANDPAIETYTDYDAWGNVWRTWTFVEKQENTGTRLYAVKEYTYDLLGRVLTAREYTDLHARGSLPQQAAYQQTAYQYDQPVGEQATGVTKDTVTDANGGVTETYYNQMGQVVKEIQKGKETGSGDKQIVKQWIYDSYGRQVSVKQGASEQNQQGSKRYAYDAYDRVETEYIGEGGLGNSQGYTKYRYDSLGRRTEMEDHADGDVIRTQWRYDKNNQAIALLQDGKIVRYTYNAAGQMTSMRYSAGNAVTDGQSGNVRTILYTYNENGQLTSVRSGNIDAAASNEAAHAQAKTVKSYTYAPNGDWTGSVEYLEFDKKADGQGVQLTQENEYDAQGRLTEQRYKQGETEKEAYTMTYDGRNYIRTSSYTDAYGTQSKTYDRSYAYDAIGRLKTYGVTQGEKAQSIAYTYDAAGNRVQEKKTENGEVSSYKKYTYNNLYQLTKTQVGKNGTEWLTEAEYEYDAYGNQSQNKQYKTDMTAWTSEWDTTVYYTYDAANQLSKVEGEREGVERTELSRNVYNGEGQRIRQYEQEQEHYKQYFYMGGALAMTSDASDPNNLVGENILAPDGTILASLRAAKEGETDIEGSQYWVYHYDAQGSVTNIVGTDKTGALDRAEENVYDPFGKAEEGQAESKIENEIKYTGAVLDNSGVYYLSARHYDPNTGRFLQQDTYKGDPYSPWTQNLYTYTGNNPTNYVDPTGHSFWDAAASALWGLKLKMVVFLSIGQALQDTMEPGSTTPTNLVPSPKATTPGGAYDERYVRTFQEYNLMMKNSVIDDKYMDLVGNMTEEMFGAILEAGKKIDYQTQIENPGFEAGGMIQRINGKLAFEQEKVISTTNRNSVTYRIGAKGEAIIHGHGVYSDKEDRIIGDMDYNNQFSNTDTDTFVKMGDAVIYDVLVGQNGSIQVREKYQIGRRWIVTAPIIISNPIRDTPSR